MQNENAIELTGPIVGKADSQQIAYGAVLVPGEPDSDGEVLTAETIAEKAHGYAVNFRHVDVQHSVKAIDADPVETYLEPVDRIVTIGGEKVIVPAGTWVMGVKVRDAETWAAVKSGKLTGFSVMGVPRNAVDAALKSQSEPAYKRTLLADLGDDWIAPFVSLVDDPAVPKAKFFALKTAKPQGFISRIFSSKTNRGEEEMNKDEIQAVVTDAVTAAVKELSEKVDAIAAKQAEPVVETELETKPDENAETVESLKSKVEELTGKLEASEADAVAVKSKIEEIEKRMTPSRTRILKSQAAGEEEKEGEGKKPESDRDGFGRRIRK